VATLLILGAGGHGRVVADTAMAQGLWSAIGATDRNAARCEGELLPGVPLLLPEVALRHAEMIHVAIGDAQGRRTEAQACGVARLATVVHPRAAASPHARLGAGCLLAAQSVVAPGARLGLCVIVNHGAVVDHDCEVGDFGHVAPMAALGGGVHLGECVLIGAGVSVLPGLSICAGTVIGAGSVVRRNIVQAGVYAGVPARRIK
jgi:sugar O-acyltransferase (sialic acid O-acetyltransferase NeuD family)